MPGSNCETWRRICAGLDSNKLVICWSYNYSERWITASNYVDILRNQVCPMVQMLFPNNDANWPIRTARSVRIGARSTKMHFNIFPGQQNRRT